MGDGGKQLAFEPPASPRVRPCRHLDPGCLASRTARGYISVVSSHPVCGRLLRRPQEVNTVGELEQEINSALFSRGLGSGPVNPDFSARGKAPSQPSGGGGGLLPRRLGRDSVRRGDVQAGLSGSSPALPPRREDSSAPLVSSPGGKAVPQSRQGRQPGRLNILLPVAQPHDAVCNWTRPRALQVVSACSLEEEAGE